MFPPARSAKTEAFYDLTELKKAKFQLLCDKCRFELIKTSLICTIYHWQTIWGESWAVGGGEASPLPSPVDIVIVTTIKGL